MKQRHKATRLRLAIALIMAGVLVGLAGCTSVQPPTPTGSTQVAPSFVISYADAADRLTGLAADEAQDQIRDWTLTGVAAHLGLDTAQLRDAAYDTLPVRDPGFADLTRQVDGPGRSLYDGKGVLHLLVPRDDPHGSRTIGLLLDQYRTDAGADARQVQVHRYRIDTTARTVSIFDDPVTPTAKARSTNGYVTMAIGTVTDLTNFLSRTSYLSRIELHGTQAVASGWNWQPAAGARVTAADVSALQGSYTDPNAHTLPGFSLDPQRVTKTQDLLAVVPGLSPGLAAAIINNNWAGSGYSSAADLDQHVRQGLGLTDQPSTAPGAPGLPTDRTQLWALDSQLTGGPAYSQARYDGDIAGTAVGMTLFYTDFEAKNWSTGVGKGVPTKAVPGFVPDDLAVTPWSECTPDDTQADQSGRLWFGENPSAVAFGPNDISIGAQATQLFLRSDSANGAEVQPPYSFGRGLTWWDQHYQEVADYEPQYQRLDDIMRWSDALDWLATKTSVTLPRLPDSSIPSNLRFADWYAQHPELKERSTIDFVTPPSATQEAVSHVPTVVFPDCGFQVIRGGVSLGDLVERERDNPYHADLPSSVSRAGPIDPTSYFDESLGNGIVVRYTIGDTGNVTDQLKQTVTTKGGTADVETTGTGRAVESLGDLKIARSAVAPSTTGLDLNADNGQVSEQVSVDGQDFGALMVTSFGDTVSVRWRSGVLDRAQKVMTFIQQRLAGNSPIGTDGALETYQTPEGNTMYAVGGSWLRVDNEVPPAGSEMVLQAGGPNLQGGVSFAFGTFVPSPHLNSAWIDITPAKGGHDAAVAGGSPPDPPDPPNDILVTTSDGGSATVHVRGDHLLVPAADPIVGLEGRAEAMAMLRDFPRIQQAMKEASQANDGYGRGVDLGDDGAALVWGDHVHIMSTEEAGAGQVQRAARENRTPLFKKDLGMFLEVEKPNLGSPSNTVTMDLGAVQSTPSADVYINEIFRNTLAARQGPVIHTSLPADTRVRVREYPAPQPTIANSIPQADILEQGGAEWYRLGGPVFMPFPEQSTNSTPTPTSSVVVPQPRGGTKILLICPADTAGVAGCH
jgi:hypothetical protein